MTYQPLPNPPRQIDGKGSKPKKAVPLPNPKRGAYKMKPAKKNFAD